MNTYRARKHPEMMLTSHTNGKYHCINKHLKGLQVKPFSKYKRQYKKPPIQRETVAMMRAMQSLYGLPPESANALANADNALKWGAK